jgi:hypothetical protein
MNEEDFRKIAKEYAEIYFTKGIDSTKIFKYVDELEKKVEQLKNIRKKAIEYIKNDSYFDGSGMCATDLLNILNKGE